MSLIDEGKDLLPGGYHGLWFWKEATVARDIQIVTVADHDRTGQPPTATIEHGRVFIIQRDGKVGDRYEAEVYLLGPM